MILDYLSSKWSSSLQDGWGALEIGNIEKAEQYFKKVIEREDDPKMIVFDLADAHNGLGACFVAHRDFFHATRWYNEARYLLDKHYHHEWPQTLSWENPHDRPSMRTFIGLGHLAYHKKDFKNAKKWYAFLLERDSKDELGVKRYVQALEKKEEFPA